MAQVDFFLKIDGVDGESGDSKHKAEIDVLSWSWGAANGGRSTFSAGGGGAGKVVMNDFTFSMTTNKASPVLMLACASGKHIPKAVLTCRKAGTEQQEYMKVTMEDLIVSSFQAAGAGGEDVMPADTDRHQLCQDQNRIRAAEEGRHARCLPDDGLGSQGEHQSLTCGPAFGSLCQAGCHAA